MFDPGMSLWEFVVPGVKQVRQHAEQVEIDEPWTSVQQVSPGNEHLLEWHQLFSQLCDKRFLFLPPFINTAAPELPFFMPQESDLLALGNKFLPMDIVQFEAGAFNVILDIAPKD